MSNIKYTVGQEVVITGNSTAQHITNHRYKLGAKCKVLDGPDSDGDYKLMNTNDVRQWVHPSCFRPVSTSSSIEEYKARPRVADDLKSLVDDEQPTDIAHGF